MSPFQFILGTINFFLIAFLVYFMLVLRPAQIKLEKHEKFLKELKTGDRIMTSGGIFGKVASVSPTAVTVEIASGTKVSFHPDHVKALPSEPEAATSEQKSASVVKGGKVSTK